MGEDPASKFAIAKFQQRELERQEKLRVQLGLRSERGGHHAAQKREIAQKAEDQLQFNFRLLQAMDQISLAVCCTTPPQFMSRDLFAHPGDTETLKLELKRQGNDLTVSPWPFATERIELKIPGCRVPRRRYKDDNDLRQTHREAPSEILTSIVTSG
jgi:hypothetical protein